MKRKVNYRVSTGLVNYLVLKYIVTMNNLRFLVVFSLILMIPAGIAAQNRDSAPHVTGIQVESSNSLIRLTWNDSPEARGPVYIYRSARPFSGSIPANIRPVVVRYGQQYYVDDTDDLGNVHYFIAASDTSGRRFDLFYPGINSTSVNFAESDERERPSISVTGTPVIREIIQGISNISAIQDGEKAVITFDTSAPRRTAILFRSTQPIKQPQDLLNAVIVKSGIISPFIDYPVPGIIWYYAVIFEDEISSGSMGIKPGVNATVTPVRITTQQSSERTLRPIPLPILTLRNAMPEGFSLDTAEQIPLSTDSVDMLRSTNVPLKQPMVLKSPRVFAVDLEAPTGGEDSALFQIVMEYFVNFQWESARVSLQHYLSLPRSRDVEVRAHFYLGQTLYFTKKYKEALMEFLNFRANHPIEANSWIDAVLTAMVY